MLPHANPERIRCQLRSVTGSLPASYGSAGNDSSSNGHSLFYCSLLPDNGVSAPVFQILLGDIIHVKDEGGKLLHLPVKLPIFILLKRFVASR